MLAYDIFRGNVRIERHDPADDSPDMIPALPSVPLNLATRGPDYWNLRAEEDEAIAENFSDPVARRLLLSAATAYRKIAQSIEAIRGE